MGKNFIIGTLLVALVALGFWRAGEMAPLPAGKAEPSLAMESGGKIDVALPALDAVFQEIEEDPALANAAFGFCLLDSKGGMLAGRNEKTPMIPASTLKTLTVAGALETLGEDFRFETVVEAEGDPGQAHLETVVIRGGGDPTLAMETLEKWAGEMQARGVKSMGQVLADASIFPTPTVGDFWGWGDVGNAYGSPVAGLNLNHNRFRAAFAPGKVGDAARFIGAVPEVPGVTWENGIKTGPAGSGDGVMIYGGPDAGMIRLTGTVPAGVERFEVGGAVPDPARFTAFHFDRLLRERGITISRPPMAGSATGLRRWMSHRSASLLEISRHLQATSDNHEAECFFRMMGVKGGGDAAVVLRQHWEARGLNLGSCRIVDGSGLSRANYLPAETLATLQFLATTGPVGGGYRSGLNPAHGGRVKWKGGAMSAVRCYTGLVTMAGGREGYFAMMFNHYPDGAAVEKHVAALVRAMTGDQ
ncbi:MAG: D-alanyl-D-alanine carboxypeptidase/D-alanyl-D-alanine-endopeptidase [Akkermansiaceae bacterium]|jgi:D-alanyl-D-alanine carboxypeptidase/D-alanyl-D-alanine-endopeptidase (penicillin-binding protein 4)|nr:D-alanyl-D-alanine carboxypeptidase/D-alanyl-D-alanine-endopeptidase [Akkermansiaceae bacterium]